MSQLDANILTTQIEEILNLFFNTTFVLKYCEYEIKVEGEQVYIKLKDNLLPKVYLMKHSYYFNKFLVLSATVEMLKYRIEDGDFKSFLIDQIVKSKGYCEYLKSFNGEY